MAGPYKLEDLPFDNYVQSPLGLVEKSSGRTRLIFHLSFDFEKYRSINFHTPKELCTVQYTDLDDAVRYSLKVGSSILYYGKTDVSNAFRILPTSRLSWRWTHMQVTDPETGETVYFLDRALPFGASISCCLFQRFSNCMKHILEWANGGIPYRLCNYLDDFLIIESSK